MNHFNSLRLILLLLVEAIFLGSCRKENLPLVSTTTVSDITSSTATSGGSISDFGSSDITACGISWGTDSLPTINNNRIIAVANNGNFVSIMTGLEMGKKYYVRAYAINSAGVGYGSSVSFITTLGDGNVLTKPVVGLTDKSATLEGFVVSDIDTDPASVSFEYGLTESYGNELSTTRTVSESPVYDEVSASLNGLSNGTTYHYRIKQVSSQGTFYGDDMEFTTLLKDMDGNIYHSVIIGSQEWMVENLKTTKFNNGDIIQTTFSSTADISNETYPEYQWPGVVAAAGRFYTYLVVTDSRNICPDGWHVPTDDDWTVLTDYLSANGFGFKGQKEFIAKSMAATYGWITDTTAGNVGNDPNSNNRSGFTGVSGGGRFSSGEVDFVGMHSIWWSSTQSSATAAYFRCIGYIPGKVYRGVFSKAFGLPVRCLRNS